MDFQYSFIASYVVTYVIFALMCPVLLVRIGSNTVRDLEAYFFRLMLYVLMTYCLIESVWAIGHFGLSDAIARASVPLSIINHCMIMLICFYWFCYVEARIRSRLADRMQYRIIAAIPLLVAILITISSLWTGWVFFQPEGAQIERGPLYLLVLLVTYAYPAVATVRTIQAGLASTVPAEQRQFFTMALFALPPAVAGVVDTFVPMLPIVAPAFFMSMLIIFTSLQEAQISHDALTGLNNRRRAERYFDEELAHASPENPFYYFVIDGDNFKQVNDIYGHLEGDSALRRIADGIKEACNEVNVLAARWGGDEFAVMGFQDDIGDPEQFASHIQNCVAAACTQEDVDYTLTVTVGYAQTADPGHSKQALIGSADAMLYERKRVRRARSA